MLISNTLFIILVVVGGFIAIILVIFLLFQFQTGAFDSCLFPPEDRYDQ